jgi:hypothetical protein
MVAKKKAAETGTEIVDWEAQMRREAEIAAGAQRSQAVAASSLARKREYSSLTGPLAGEPDGCDHPRRHYGEQLLRRGV